MIYAGIDAGSRAIKIALIDEDNTILQTGISAQGVRQTELAMALLERTLSGAGEIRQNIMGQ